MVLALCERFGCLPSQLEAEDAELLRLVAIVNAGTPEGGEPDA
jgi:hypothetical protein